MQNFYINKEDGKRKKKTYFELPVVTDKNNKNNKTRTFILVILAIVFVIGSTFFAVRTIKTTANEFSASIKKASTVQVDKNNVSMSTPKYDSNVDKGLTIFVLNVSGKENEAEKVVNKLKNDGFNKVSVQQFIGDKTGAETGVYFHEQTSELTAKNIANKLKIPFKTEHGFTTSGWNIIIIV